MEEYVFVVHGEGILEVFFLEEDATFYLNEMDDYNLILERKLLN